MVTADRMHSLLSNFETLAPVLNALGPAQLAERRAERFERFRALGLPTTRDEEFKYLPLHALNENTFQPAYGATVVPSDLYGSPLGGFEAITLTFVNGEFAPELSNVSGLPNGARLLPLAEAFEQHEGLVARGFGQVATLEGRLGSTNDERFVHLNDAYFADGAFLFVSRGVAVELPIHLQFVSRPDHGPFAAHPRIVIVLEDGAQAKVVESYLGLDAGLYFTNPVTEILLGQDAMLEHVKFQSENPEATHIGAIYVHQNANSTYNGTNVAFGASVSRNDVNVYIGGQHTETWLNGAYLGTESQIHDNHTRIDHAEPNCHSFEVYKGILDDKSVGVFNGKIFVYEDAQKTDAKQTNQALLLSPTATINTKPQLEIFADDVKCTHGATVGQIREDALFYLRARGIPYDQARGLMVYAFVAEVLEKISLEPVKEALEKTLFARLIG